VKCGGQNPESVFLGSVEKRTQLEVLGSARLTQLPILTTKLVFRQMLHYFSPTVGLHQSLYGLSRTNAAQTTPVDSESIAGEYDIGRYSDTHGLENPLKSVSASASILRVHWKNSLRQPTQPTNWNTWLPRHSRDTRTTASKKP
jgi:hypothetical protein